jgi:ATP-dependent helicase/DNAse subunit B
MLLLSGPPGSDRTSRVLAEFRQALPRDTSGIRLLVPTAAMAEHLRHKLAREGFVLRPNLILTLSKFVAPWAEDLPEVSPAVLYLLVEKAAHCIAAPEFARVLSTPGFCAALAQAVEEFSGAGCDSARLERALPSTQFGPAFVAVYAQVEQELARRGLSLRSGRLVRAAQRIAGQGLAGVNTVWMDGFLALTDPELAVIRAIGAQAELTVTLPLLDDPNATRDALLAMGFEEERLARERAEPAVHAFSAPTIDREAEEIARRILNSGGAFGEIGIIVRNPDVYLHPLRAALERFGIPARFHFADSLGEHGTVRYLAGVVKGLQSGWEHATTLAAIRLSDCSGALDRFDFAVREQLPGCGLEVLKQLTEDGRIQRLLDKFGALERWRDLTLTPSQWASRLCSLRGLVRSPRPEDGAGMEKVMLWRSQAAALAAFEAAMEEAAQSLEETRRISLDEFWVAAAAVLRLSPLRVADHRRNVVHVLSVFEARQWELPVVFICGLAEQQFPKRHAQEPLFSDGVRQRLAQSGIRIRPAAELEREERFLFELARTSATATLTLSYAEADSRGVRNLRSQFLKEVVSPCTETVRPAPEHKNSAPVGKSVETSLDAADTSVRATPAWGVRPTMRTFSPSGLECFLDCPFQFFARYTLKLRTRPLAPQDRLDFMLQGTIVHQTLSEWHLNPQPIEPLFERIFAENCARKRVFMGCRTEYLRRQMLDDLRQFCDSGKLPAASEVRTEHPFEMAVDDSLLVRGRIDRIDRLPDGRALIVDYKYSAAANVAAKMDKATLLQPGLYALAAERALGLKPAGVFYFGLKDKLKVVGWSDPPGAFGIKTEPLTREWIDGVVQIARTAAEQIREGRVAAMPASLELCRLCDFRDVCRYDVAVRTLTAT